MYFTIIIVIVLYSFIAHAVEQTPNSFEIREHTLTRPYPSVFSTSNSHWSLTGNTLVTDRYIRLTQDTQSKAGGLWNTIPVTYPDWEMHVQFKVYGEGKGFFGDGFVIWYVKDPKLNGPVFGYKDYFEGLAIMMDTYANKNDPYHHTYPYISAVVNNGSLHYDHDRDGSDINLAGCEASIRGRDSDTFVAIRYQHNRLTISTDLDGANTWKECFSVENIYLPTHYYFGFSAATGQLSDNHDIISVHTYQLDTNEERLKENRKYIVPSGPAEILRNLVDTSSTSSSWSAFKIFLFICLLVVLVLGGIAAYYYFEKRRYYHSRLY